MKAATVTTLKNELKHLPEKELVEICLKLAKFKKENKELLTYLLFEADDEDSYIKEIKVEMNLMFDEINTSHIYYVKKGVRKVLRQLKKYIRYSKKKETETELLLYFCGKLHKITPSIMRSQQMKNLYERQLSMAKKAMKTLHEDVQYDFKLEIEELEN